MECEKDQKGSKINLAAEMLNLEESLEAGIYYLHMLEDVLRLEARTIKIKAIVDNKSVIEALLSTRMVKDKRLRVDVTATQESLKLHDIDQIQ